jgi:hypothetical protein
MTINGIYGIFEMLNPIWRYCKMENNQKSKDVVLDFIMSQDLFIRISIFVGIGFMILYLGYLVGGFIARITG